MWQAKLVCVAAAKSPLCSCQPSTCSLFTSWADYCYAHQGKVLASVDSLNVSITNTARATDNLGCTSWKSMCGTDDTFFACHGNASSMYVAGTMLRSCAAVCSFLNAAEHSLGVPFATLPRVAAAPPTSGTQLPVSSTYLKMLIGWLIILMLVF